MKNERAKRMAKDVILLIGIIAACYILVLR